MNTKKRNAMKGIELPNKKKALWKNNVTNNVRNFRNR